jgi:hypothetical protein
VLYDYTKGEKRRREKWKVGGVLCAMKMFFVQIFLFAVVCIIFIYYIVKVDTFETHVVRNTTGVFKDIFSTPRGRTKLRWKFDGGNVYVK